MPFPKTLLFLCTLAFSWPVALVVVTLSCLAQDEAAVRATGCAMAPWARQTYKAAEIVSLVSAPFAIGSVVRAKTAVWSIRLCVYAAALASAALAVYLGLRGGRL